MRCYGLRTRADRMLGGLGASTARAQRTRRALWVQPSWSRAPAPPACCCYCHGGWLAGWLGERRTRAYEYEHICFFYGLRLTRYTIEASGYVGRAFMTVCVFVYCRLFGARMRVDICVCGDITCA